MPGVIIAVIVALIVSNYLKNKKKKEQARQSAQLSPADERKMSARPEARTGALTDLDLDEMEQMLRKMRPEQETPEKEAASPAPDESLARRVVDYYAGMWNRLDGTLFTDPAMTIDHFAIHLETDRLTDSVWLEGSAQPLVSDTAYSALPGQSEVTALEDAQRAPLYEQVKDALLKLGTVQCRNELFYPVHTAPENDPKADLEAQMQELLKAKKEKAVG